VRARRYLSARPLARQSIPTPRRPGRSRTAYRIFGEMFESRTVGLCHAIEGERVKYPNLRILRNSCSEHSYVGGGSGPQVAMMFRVPAYDPVAIAVLGFGILLAAALTFAF
jgi:hypothetical protein